MPHGGGLIGGQGKESRSFCFIAEARSVSSHGSRSPISIPARRRSCMLFYAAHREELYHDKGVGDPYAQQEKDDRGNHGERRP